MTTVPLTKTLATTFLFLLTCPAHAAPLSGKVVELEGQAQNLTTHESLRLNSEIAVGDLIKTEAGTKLRAVLGRDVAIQLGPSSEVRLAATADTSSGWTATLIAGRLMSAVRKTVAAVVGATSDERMKFSIHTGNSVMGVRGTVVYLAHKPHVATFACVCRGTAELKETPAAALRSFHTKHHDSPTLFDERGRTLALTALDASYTAHTDSDMNALARLANSAPTR